MPDTKTELRSMLQPARMLLAGWLLVPLALFPASANSQEAQEREIKPCVECHEAFFAIADSKHFVAGDARTPKGTGAECEACHGDAKPHNKAPRAKDRLPVRFGVKQPAEAQNEKCLACHQTGTRIHWQGSSHDRAQVPCAACHKAHAAKDAVMVEETQAGVCFECHKDRRADMLKVSAHPLKTGFFACSSCHASHGSTTRALMQKNTVNDTCYSCHADKRGPFLWEHRPVVDDCTNCHNPHGTNYTPMLKVRVPYLCQSCHQATFHPSNAYSGTDIAASAAFAVGRGCPNCHQKVHGSNHPSGARLQR